MIPNAFVETLLDRVDIVDVIDRVVPLKKAGTNYLACCPFHKEKSPSFTVSPNKQFYHCFGCGASGSAVGFVMEYHGLGFVEAVQTLADSVGLSVPQSVKSNPEVARAAHEKKISLEDVLNRANDFYKAQLRLATPAIDYLKGRGLTGKIAAQYDVGYAPEHWDSLKTVFSDYDAANLVEAGLVIFQAGSGKRYDRFRGRIMFPIRNARGLIIGFGGRVLPSETGHTGASKAKYLNSPETPLFEKNRELYGLFEGKQAIRDSNQVLVVEGYIDVVALAQHGIGYAVATLGTATSEEHIKKLLRHADTITFCFDGDKAGKKAAWKALENSLTQLVDGKTLNFLFLSEEHDPDSFVRAFGAAHLETLIQKEALPLSTFFVTELSRHLDLHQAEGRAQFVSRALPLLAKIKAPTLGLLIKKRVAHLAEVELAELQYLSGETQAKIAPARAKKYQLPLQSHAPKTVTKVRKLIQWILLNPELSLTVHIPDSQVFSAEMATLAALIEHIQSSYEIEKAPRLSSAFLLETFRNSPHEAVLFQALKTANQQDGVFEELKPDDKKAVVEGFTALLGKIDDEIFERLSKKGLSLLSDEEKQLMQTLMKRMQIRRQPKEPED